MNQFYLSSIPKNGRIHFVGIGGISMSGLAEILFKKGYHISGSDINETHITRHLQSLGIEVVMRHKASNAYGADLVVYTAAVSSDNPELVWCEQVGIPCIERATLLGGLMREYECSICVAGTHGKTTTTSMLSHILLAAQKDPTIILGGELDAIGGNFRGGGDKYFLTEACEYHCSFLQFFPKVAVITNVDADHLDFFEDLKQIKQAFLEFARLPGRNGAVVVCGDDDNAMDCVLDTDARVITYGLSETNEIRPQALSYNSTYAEFDINYHGETIHVTLNVPGAHNVLNALACFAVGDAIGLPGKEIAKGLKSFVGVHRRFEKKGVVGGAIVIDDYAHHPTEVRATLATAAKMASGRVIVAFQPHTYSRTLHLIDEFAAAFDDADQIIITDIYAAREKDNGMIHARDLAQRLADRGKNVEYIALFEDIASYIYKNIRPGDIVITMGAGSIYKVGETLINRQAAIENAI